MFTNIFRHKNLILHWYFLQIYDFVRCHMWIKISVLSKMYKSHTPLWGSPASGCRLCLPLTWSSSSPQLHPHPHHPGNCGSAWGTRNTSWVTKKPKLFFYMYLNDKKAYITAFDKCFKLQHIIHVLQDSLITAFDNCFKQQHFPTTHEETYI